MDIVKKECGEIKKYKNKKRDLLIWVGVGIVIAIASIALCFLWVVKGEADHEIGKQLVTHQNCVALSSDSLRETTKEECTRAAIYANGSKFRQYFTYGKYGTEDYFEDWAILNPKVWVYTIFAGGFVWIAKMVIQFGFSMAFGGVFRKAISFIV